MSSPTDNPWRRVLLASCFSLALLIGSVDTEAANGLYINEFVASNAASLLDEDGDSSDWIELTNSEVDSLDVSAYFLSDDPLDLEKWPFPSMDVAPGAYLVVFASGKDRRDPAQTLHTDFQLNKAAGSSLILSRSVDGGAPEIVFQYADLPEQHEDVSYGVVGNDSTVFGFFQAPTPGAANDETALQGYVADTQFSVDRGLYDVPFDLVITCATPGATLIHTTDGSPPSPTNGFKTIPTPDATPEVALTISSTSTIRAMAMKSGFEPTNVDTQTYLFPDHVLGQDGAGLGGVNWGHAGPDWEMDPEVVQHADPANRAAADDLKGIPSVCLSLPFDDMWGANGIYPSGQGVEKVTAVELLNPDGDEANPNLRSGFKAEGTVQIVGGSSPSRWKTDKLSMRLKFQPDLRFPVFGDEATDDFDTLVLDARLNNVWHYGGGVSPTAQRDRAQYLRDQYAADLQRSLGGHAPHGQHVHLYINGIYWGIHTLHERPDDNFAASYLGGDNEDYYVVKHTPNDVIQGGAAATADYNALHALAEQNMADTGNYSAVAAKLDIDDFIDYMLINYYGGNGDWAHHNWYASRNFVDPDGKWRFHSWDAEKVVEGVNDDRTGLDNAGGPTHLHRRLVGNEDYRLRFADRVRETYFHGGPLTPERAGALYLQRANNISGAIRAESARWGDNQRSEPYLHEDWQNTLDGLLNDYFPKRTEIVLNQFRNRGWYPDVEAPEFSRHGGFLTSSEALTMLGSGEIWYTVDGSDPRGPDGQPSASAESYEGTADTETLLAAGSNWKFLDDGSNQGTAWRQPGFEDGAWSSGAGKFGFGDGNEETTVSFGDDAQNKHVTTYFRTTMEVGDTESILSATARTLHDDGVVIYLNGEEVGRSNMPAGTISYDTFALDSHNDAEETTYFAIDVETTKLVNGENILAVEVHQNSATSSDLGFDMEFVVTRASEGDGAVRLDGPGAVTLRARALDSGEWSALTSAEFYVDLDPASAANLVISEIMYHPADVTEAELLMGFDNPDLFEFLEVTNISGEWLSLQDLLFTDGIEFDFANAERESIAPGESLLLVKDEAAFEFRYGAGLPVTGRFGGNLRNSGETLTLSDRSGAIIWSFTYDDVSPWPLPADGDGYSLVLVGAESAPDPTDAAQWTTSRAVNGSPGSLESESEVTYALVTSVDGEGTVERLPSSIRYAAGQSVSLEAQADPGWAFIEWSGDLIGSQNPVTLTMDFDRSVEALFKRVHTPEVVVSGEGSIEMTPSASSYVEGSAVTLTPVAAAGYRFAGWSGDLTGAEVPLEITIDSALMIGATFIPQYEVTTEVIGNGSVVLNPDEAVVDAGSVLELLAIPADGHRFVGWSGDVEGTANPLTVTVETDLHAQALFMEEVRLTLAVEGDGTIEASESGSLLVGTEVTLEAVPATGWEFVSWTGDLESTENPLVFAIDGDTVIEAVFARRSVTLTTAVLGEGDVLASATGNLYHGDEVTVTAVPAEGWEFAEWVTGVHSEENPVTVTLAGDLVMTARFVRQYTLATAVEGEGSVTLSPEGGVYGAGTEVTVTAMPSAGSLFSRWEGDLSGTALSTLIVMAGDRSITAVFEPLPSGYEAWQTIHFNEVERSAPEISGLLADPDGDQVVNLFEYGMGGHPWDPSNAPRPRAELVEHEGSHHVRLVFPRLLDAEASLQWLLESSDDLRNWTEATQIVTDLPDEPSAEGTQTATMEEDTPIGEDQVRYYRLTLQLADE